MSGWTILARKESAMRGELEQTNISTDIERWNYVGYLYSNIIGILKDVRMAAVSLKLHIWPYVMNPMGIRLRIDPSDRRALQLSITRGVKARYVVPVWSLLADCLEPQFVIDVGANYGEVIFSRGYPPGAQLHLIEANPRVASCLAQTIEENDLQVSLHVGAASSLPGTASLHIAPRYSGTATVEPGWRPDDRVTMVNTFRVSDVMAYERIQRALFKIDVEGHEWHVLEGMKPMLSKIPRWGGLVEFAKFDQERLRALGLDCVPFAVRRSDLCLVPIHRSGPTIGLGGDSAYTRDVILWRGDKAALLQEPHSLRATR